MQAESGPTTIPASSIAGRAGVSLTSPARLADLLLRLAVLLFALGLARALFTRAGTSFGSIALLEWGVSHDRILLIEKLGAGLVLVCAVSLFIRPTVLALVVVSGLVFGEAWAGIRAGGFPFSELTPYASALRYLTPLALIPLVASAAWFGGRLPRYRISAWILRIGIATVFAIHGYEAWMLHPQFIDFIIGSGMTLGGLEISEAAASTLLKGIAIVDVIVAVLVLLHTSPALLGWLCLWGLVTALSRPVSLGFASYPEVLLRASHVLAPLAVGLLVAAIRAEKVAARPSSTSQAAATPTNIDGGDGSRGRLA